MHSPNPTVASVRVMTGKTALWAMAAVLGLVLAAGMSFATSQLTSQHIGIGSEPLTAGRRLAPPPPAATRRTTTPSRTTSTSPRAPETTQTRTAAPVVPAQPSVTEGEAPAVTSPAPAAGSGRETSGDDQAHRSGGSARQGRDD